MVLKLGREIDTGANVPAGAPKPSHVRELLLTLKMRLEAQLNPNGVAAAADSNGRPGLTDAFEIHDTVVERGVQSNIARQLEQVNESLTRIDDGKYGICADCLQPIAADRLVVRPFSTLCMGCQNRFDRGKVSRF